MTNHLIYICDHVNELAAPFVHVEKYSIGTGRTLKAKIHRTTSPSLIDQVADLADPANTAGRPRSGIRSAPGSTPAANTAALDLIAHITTGATAWLDHTGVRRDGDLTTRLRALVGVAAAFQAADRCAYPRPREHTRAVCALATDVAAWHTSARILTGWDERPFIPSAPCMYCNAPSQTGSGLRIALDRSTARCVSCRQRWSGDTMITLARYLSTLSGYTLTVA